MHDIHSLIASILKDGYLMSLASVDESGPWVSDVIYCADQDFRLYFISRLEFRHSKAFIQNPKAAGAITVIEKPEGQSTGVQFEGIVVQIEKIPDTVLVAYSQKRDTTSSWKLGDGEAWYCLNPSKFDLIHEPLFGYTKKSFVLS
jgi:uncharacterized protein YhbP (UPF0306 family)